MSKLCKKAKTLFCPRAFISWAKLQLFALYRPFLGVCCKKTCMPVQGFKRHDYIAVAEFCFNHENVAKVYLNLSVKYCLIWPFISLVVCCTIVATGTK